MVRSMVEAINAGEIEGSVDELFAPRAARRVKRLFAEFRSAFHDWREEIVDLVAAGDTVTGRFRCSGTHRGKFLGESPHGQAHGGRGGVLAGGGREVRAVLGTGERPGQTATAGTSLLAEQPIEGSRSRLARGSLPGFRETT